MCAFVSSPVLPSTNECCVLLRIWRRFRFDDIQILKYTDSCGELDLGHLLRLADDVCGFVHKIIPGYSRIKVGLIKREETPWGLFSFKEPDFIWLNPTRTIHQATFLNTVLHEISHLIAARPSIQGKRLHPDDKTCPGGHCSGWAAVFSMLKERLLVTDLREFVALDTLVSLLRRESLEELAPFVYECSRQCEGCVRLSRGSLWDRLGHVPGNAVFDIYQEYRSAYRDALGVWTYE